MIHIAYAVWNASKTYYIYTGISMTSVMEHTKAKICFHILHDELLEETQKAEMQRLCADRNQQIRFHLVQMDERISRREMYGSGYGDGIFYRIYLPQLLPAQPRVLYLDSDVIAELDIETLWQTDLQGCLVGAVWDPPKFGLLGNYVYDRERMRPFLEQMDWNTYFNSGVMLMDLDKIRETHDLVEETVQFFARFPMRFPDQDALNWIFRSQVQFLDGAYNTFAYYLLQQPRKGILLHYTKLSREPDTLDACDQVVLSYWKKSVWYDASYRATDQVRLLSGLKTPETVKKELLAYPDWREEEWQETAEKLKNQEPMIPADQTNRFLRAVDAFRQKQYAQATELFRQCLFYGTELANKISLSSLQRLTKCAIHLGRLNQAEAYNRMVGVLEPEGEAYKANRLLLEWKKSKGAADASTPGLAEEGVLK